MTTTVGIPPKEVTTLLRIEGLAVFVGAIAVYAVTGGNWWLFAALLLAPDLSFLVNLAGKKAGAITYNFAHTYSVPALLVLVGWISGAGWLYTAAIIWFAHIGMDRTLGYGLKYPGSFDHTHLGLIGKAKRA